MIHPGKDYLNICYVDFPLRFGNYNGTRIIINILLVTSTYILLERNFLMTRTVGWSI